MANSYPGLLYISNGDQLERYEPLIGKNFYKIASEGERIVVCCRDASYFIESDDQIQQFGDSPLVNISAGTGFIVGIGLNSRLYSWGVEGDSGQLGQSASIKKLFEPLEINFVADFIDVSSGEAFNMAIDKTGLMYGWGENFDRQLGIYTKTKESMHLKNAMIEEMVFAPRLIPFSLKQPIHKVSCGSRFTIVLTKTGQVYSWGAGESGQLGTGRCTYRELPCEVSLPTGKGGTASSPTAVVDIASGQGHVLVLTADKDVMVWGLNYYHQCGLATTSPRLLTPTALPHSQNHPTFRALFAHTHSSAGIDTNGQLWTWGLPTHGRLLHAVPHTVVIEKNKEVVVPISNPTQVTAAVLQSAQVEHFVFSTTRCALVMKTTLTKIWPLKGPKRTFSKLQIHGYGLWDSAQIIVKFTSKQYSIYNPPRSCMGKYVVSDGENKIVCKPPKFAETGGYTVMVSMDGGKEFLTQTFDIWIYKEMSIVHQSPPLIDIRSLFIPKLIVKASGSKVELMDIETVSMKLHFTAVNNHNHQPIELLLEGKIIHDHPNDPTTHAITPREDHSVASGGDNTVTGGGIEHVTIELNEVDLSSYHELLTDLYDLVCSVTLNGQDYSIPSHHPAKETQKGIETKPVISDAVTGTNTHNQSSLCHSFTPHTIAPMFYPFTQLYTLGRAMDAQKKQASEELLLGSSGESAVTSTVEGEGIEPHTTPIITDFHPFERKILITGESFIPAHKLSKGAYLKAGISHVRVYQDQQVVEELAMHNIADHKLEELLIHVESSHGLYFLLNMTLLYELYALCKHHFHSEQQMDSYSLKIQFYFLLQQTVPSNHPDNANPIVTPRMNTNNNNANDLIGDKMILFDEANISLDFFADVPILATPTLFHKKQQQEAEETVEESKKKHVLYLYPKLTASEGLLSGFETNLESIVVHIHAKLGSENDNEEKTMYSYALPASTVAVVPLEDTTETEESNSKAQGQRIQCTLPDYEALVSYLHLPTVEQRSIPLNQFTVSVSLDGQTVPIESKWSQFGYYTNLAQYAITPAAPKGGFIPGSAVTLVLEDYLLGVQAHQMMLRLRGHDPAGNTAAVPVTAINDITTPKLASSVAFTLPDAAVITTVPPVMNGKEKLYFVDVSIDGGHTYETAATAMLQVK